MYYSFYFLNLLFFIAVYLMFLLLLFYICIFSFSSSSGGSSSVIIIASEMVSNPVFLAEYTEIKAPEGCVLEKITKSQLPKPSKGPELTTQLSDMKMRRCSSKI